MDFRPKNPPLLLWQQEYLKLITQAWDNGRDSTVCLLFTVCTLYTLGQSREHAYRYWYDLYIGRTCIVFFFAAGASDTGQGFCNFSEQNYGVHSPPTARVMRQSLLCVQRKSIQHAVGYKCYLNYKVNKWREKKGR